MSTTTTEETKRPDRTTMEGMIWNANHVLDTALSPECRGVPRMLMEECKGVAMISVVEAGFMFAGSVGTGVICAKQANGQWGPPSAIGMGGVGFGFIVGADVKDVIFLLDSDSAVKTMTAQNQIKLGAELGLAIGPVGREMDANFAASGKGAGVALSYTFSKGLFVGAGLNGTILRSRNKENAKFYDKEGLTPEEILLEQGAVDIPPNKGIEELHTKLELMCKGETLTPTAEDEAKKESLRNQAEEAGKSAKEEQGDEVQHVEASTKAKEEEEEKPKEETEEKPKEEAEGAAKE